jgi:hypothetical protein
MAFDFGAGPFARRLTDGRLVRSSCLVGLSGSHGRFINRGSGRAPIARAATTRLYNASTAVSSRPDNKNRAADCAVMGRGTGGQPFNL